MSSSITLDESKSDSILLYLLLAFLFSWVVLGLAALAANGTIVILSTSPHTLKRRK